MYLKINRIVKNSKVEGPGNRFVIWVQGCTIRCPFCINKDTWDLNVGKKMKLTELLYEIQTEKNISGITILGGEPFLQPKVLYRLIEKVKRNKLSVILFTGYDHDFLLANGSYYQKKLLKAADLLIDGAYEENQKDFSRPLVGSKNQNYYFLTKKINRQDFFSITNKFEIRLENDGTVRLNGMGDIEKVRQMIKSK